MSYSYKGKAYKGEPLPLDEESLKGLKQFFESIPIHPEANSSHEEPMESETTAAVTEEALKVHSPPASCIRNKCNGEECGDFCRMDPAYLKLVELYSELVEMSRNYVNQHNSKNCKCFL